MSVVKSGPPDQLVVVRGPFFIGPPAGDAEGKWRMKTMERTELAIEKQGFAAIRDWDVFQAVLRAWSRRMRGPAGRVAPGTTAASSRR